MANLAPPQNNPFKELSNASAAPVKKGDKTKKSKSGGFQSMALNPPIFKAILKQGYKVPTPVQRKCIPILLEGRDLVAMARTGSGKTAAFLIPILQKLGAHSQKVGVRALILSPTRELAQQTHQFCQQLSKFTDLRSCLIVGGDSVEEQFSKLVTNPDIIIATPGRLRHLLVEVENFTLKTLQFLVFDEGDRLFEMGFQDEIKEVIAETPSSRQTAIFSATLPEMLASFARAGLNDPAIVRLDADKQLAEKLTNEIFLIRAEEKDATLIYLIRDYIAEGKQIIVFTATRHHVEYLNTLIAGVCQESPAAVAIYGKMDQNARKLQLDKFTKKQAHVLLVTDLAARGIDIPALDVVINYDFPEKPKLFVHRVGRTARAGREGVAYSLITKHDLPYVMDLGLFLGKKPPVIYPNHPKASFDADELRIGSVPVHLLQHPNEECLAYNENEVEIQALKRSMNNSLKLYHKTRKAASNASSERAKEVNLFNFVHPVFASMVDKNEATRVDMVAALKRFRPSQTIFELKKPTEGNAAPAATMTTKRYIHSDIVDKYRQGQERRLLEKLQQGAYGATIQAEQQKRKAEEAEAPDSDGDTDMSEEESSSEEEDVKPQIGKKNKKKGRGRKFALPEAREQKSFKDERFFLQHTRPNSASDAGFEIDAAPKDNIEDMVLDMVPDESSAIFRTRSIQHWDQKSKKFIQLKGAAAQNVIRTESGQLLNKKKMEIKKGRMYDDWSKKNKKEIGKAGEEEDQGSSAMYTDHRNRSKYKHHKTNNKEAVSELQNIQVVTKARKEKVKRQENQAFLKKRKADKSRGPPQKKRRMK